MSYQPKIYRKQGGSDLVVASGGQIDIESGGHIDLESGGYLAAAAGGYIANPYQALGSSQTATAIVNSGVTVLTGTTTGPTYVLPAPAAAGVAKWVVLNPTSSGATHRCVVSTSAAGVKITHHSNDGDKLTLNTSAQGSALMVASGTSEWRVVGAWAVQDPAITS